MLPRQIRADGRIAIYGVLLHSARTDPKTTLFLFDLLISRYIDTRRVNDMGEGEFIMLGNTNTYGHCLIYRITKASCGNKSCLKDLNI